MSDSETENLTETPDVKSEAIEELRTITFLKQWYNRNGKPKAMIHETTKNRSFVVIHRALRMLGVKNNLFFLSLKDPKLKDVDPHKLNDETDPDGSMRRRVIRECKVNFWYFLREVVRVPAAGSDGIFFNLNRGALAMSWCYLNSINYTATQPRQTGKTTMALILCLWLFCIAGQRTTIAMLCHNETLRTANVNRFKQYRDLLPKYLFLNHRSNTNNSEKMTYGPLNNIYETAIAKRERAIADQVLRGLSIVLMHIDEVGYNANIDLTYTTLKASASNASAVAEAAGLATGFILTTTAVDPTTPSGKYAYNIISQAMSFSEKLYDLEDKAAAKAFVRKNSSNDYVNGTFSHLQLGLSNQWLEDRIRESNDATPDVIQREWLNRWVTMAGNPILDKDLVKKMMDNRQDRPDYTEIIQGYVLQWYCSEEESKAWRDRPFIAGLDCAEFAGRDFTTIVAIDPETRRVLFTFRCNESNSTAFSLMITELMTTYKKMLLVPERKSIAIGIIDDLANNLLQRGYSPFKRIYNKLVQERQTSTYTGIDLSDPSTYHNTSYRKTLGFMTTGRSRDILYRMILHKAAKLSWDRIFDKHLTEELASLEYKNGRIDHGTDKHDDMVISWLLANFVLFEGKNLMLYGMEVNEIDLPEEDGYTVDQKKQQETYRAQWAELKGRYDKADAYWKNVYRTRLNKLYELIDPNIVSSAVIDRDKSQAIVEYIEAPKPENNFDKEESVRRYTQFFSGL